MCDWDREASLCANLHKSRQFSFHVNVDIYEAGRQSDFEPSELLSRRTRTRNSYAWNNSHDQVTGITSVHLKSEEDDERTSEKRWIQFWEADLCTNPSQSQCFFGLIDARIWATGYQILTFEKNTSLKNRNKICFAWNWWRAQWKHHWGKLASSSDAELGFISGPVYTSDRVTMATAFLKIPHRFRNEWWVPLCFTFGHVN